MEDTSFLVLVQTLVGKHIKQVQCGQYYTIALTKSGYVFTWGYVFILLLQGSILVDLPVFIYGLIFCQI